MASSPEGQGGEDDDQQLSPPAVYPSPPPNDSSSAPPLVPPGTPPPPSSSESPPPAPPASSPPAPSTSPPPPPPPHDDSEASPPPPSTSPPQPTFSPPPHDSPPSPSVPLLSPPDGHPSPPSSSLPPSPPIIINTSPPPPASIGSPPSTPLSSPSPPSMAPPSGPSRGGGSPGSSSQPSGDPPSPGSNSNEGVIIAGIIVAGMVIVALLLLLMCTRRKKKSTYYTNPVAPHRAADQYYKDKNQWNSPHPGDQVVNIPPSGFMGTPVGGGGGGDRGAPPALYTSIEFSSNFSGQHQTPGVAPSPIAGGITQFTYQDLAVASGGFSPTNLLGQGGFGLVHKGILSDRREVAIKSLKAGSGQGEREFQAEVEIISRVHHRHLVSLVGYCIANGQRMLVYEFVPNKTLEFHLHGKGQPVMDWTTRLRIAVGSAKGLAYLHEDCNPRIIHRDIKAANILLDHNFEAMVADFGLAKLTSDNNTHVFTRVMGTFGYLAPEYASSGKLTEKSDVFSFGVMLLELITGRRPVDVTNVAMEDSLVDWARPLLTKAMENGDYSELVDPRLGDNYIQEELAHMASCAAASIRHSSRRRPKMSQIVRALEGDSSLDDPNEGVTQGHSVVCNPIGGTEAYDTRAYNADMMKFRKMVISSQDPDSSQYGTTSEYGLNPSFSSDESGTQTPETRSFSRPMH